MAGDILPLLNLIAVLVGTWLPVVLQPEALRLPRTLPAALLPAPVVEHARQLWTGAVFAAQQATGLSTAPHAAFKPYAIDAVTFQLPLPLSGVRFLKSKVKNVGALRH